LMSKFALPQMIAQGSGAIVNCASGWGLVGGAKAVAYCAAKGGMVMMTKAMAIDHGPQGIRVNAVCPGDTETPMEHEDAENQGLSWDEYVRRAVSGRAIERMAAPEEIARAVRGQHATVSAWFDELRAGSIDGPGVTRDTFGAGEQFGYRVIEEKARAMGLEITHDHSANMYMTLAGQDRSAPGIMFGSHIDTVPCGGNFDGAAGVIAGLVAQRALQDLGIVPPCDVTTMAVRAEESVWFQVSYIGSRTAFGVLPDGALDAKTKEMLGLCASMVLRCDDCVRYHIEKCHELGVTRAEFFDVFSVALTVGGSIVIPHLRRAVAVLDAVEGKISS